jgi:preprotein translocase subunit YajC
MNLYERLPHVWLVRQEGAVKMSQVLYWVVFVGILIGAWYFLMIRPQRAKTKEHETLLKELQRGSRVITAAGIYGEVDSVGEDTVVLKLEGGGKMKVSKASIERVEETE